MGLRWTPGTLDSKLGFGYGPAPDFNWNAQGDDNYTLGGDDVTGPMPPELKRSGKAADIRPGHRQSVVIPKLPRSGRTGGNY